MIERKVFLPVALVSQAIVILVTVATCIIGSRIVFEQVTQHNWKLERLTSPERVYMATVELGWGMLVLPGSVLIPSLALLCRRRCTAEFFAWYISYVVLVLGVWLLLWWLTTDQLQRLNAPL